MQTRPSVRYFQLLIALIGWFALIAQYYLLMEKRVLPIGATVVQYFSYFTILTNILIACWFSADLFGKGSAWRHFFYQAKNATALTVYIAIVGLVYNLVLRPLWHPTGFQVPVDEMLHSVIPVLTLIYWVLFVPKGELKWTHCFPWLIYPIVYCAYILARGAFSDLYPYPFMEVNNLGYQTVLRNIAVLFGVFILFSLAFIAIDRFMGRGIKRAD